jgi:hypothetical protein
VGKKRAVPVRDEDKERKSYAKLQLTLQLAKDGKSPAEINAFMSALDDSFL